MVGSSLRAEQSDAGLRACWSWHWHWHCVSETPRLSVCVSHIWYMLSWPRTSWMAAEFGGRHWDGRAVLSGGEVGVGDCAGWSLRGLMQGNGDGIGCWL